jgi:superfamily I DNA and RNA helicase
MVDIKRGLTDKIASSNKLVDYFKIKNELEGKFYIGYPILFAGGESIILDAVWVSKNFGIIIFDLVEDAELSNREEQRDRLYNKLYSLLAPFSDLNKRRNLLVEINVITFANAVTTNNQNDTAINFDELDNLLNRFSNWENNLLFERVLSILQSVIQIKLKIDRSYVKKTNSKGDIVRQLEETIANLDSQQEDAIIEYHNGLQRIRGLAGSGKTIVLALKAAYLHALNPDWNIAVTFNTRSLKNQFVDLIELFCIQKMGRKPDEDKIKILHAWGSSSNQGMYYEFCKENGLEYLDFRSAKVQKSLSDDKSKDLFDFVCKKAIKEREVKSIVINPKYNVILVDEAQDLSESFLNMCYLMLDKKKRLIYAYDELQKLNEGTSLRNPKIIFGEESSDIILQKCYRNSRPVLVTAHALGFGVYRKEGLAQFFDQPQLWKDVGYSTESGELKGGESVTLYRAEEATHKYIEQSVNIDDLLVFKSFSNKADQTNELVNEISKNLREDELLEKDIIVINPDALSTKDEIGLARSLLNKIDIKSHIAGDFNPDVFFEKNSVAFTGINRAKGNEVPMVYIINAQYCYSHPLLKDLDLIKRRNILFTAITRSKAWVRVYGIGENMDNLINEFQEVKSRDFKLQFNYPSQSEIDNMNVISRDLSKTEELKFTEEIKTLNGLPEILSRIKAGEAYIEDYPNELQPLLKKLISED